MKTLHTFRLIAFALLGWTVVPFEVPIASAQEDYRHPSGPQLVRLLNGSLSGAEAAKVHQHFGECADCAGFYADYAKKISDSPVCSHCGKPIEPSSSNSEPTDNSGHPTVAELALLKEGQLAEADAARVHEHFADCEQCVQAFAAMISPSDPAPAAEPAPVVEQASVPAEPADDSGHPTVAELALLKEGQLAEADAARVHEHFADCEQCVQAFAAMSSPSDPAPAAEPAPVVEQASVPAEPADDSGHPTVAELALLKEGQLAEADAVRVHEHFAACEQCIKTFAAMSAEPPVDPVDSHLDTHTQGESPSHVHSPSDSAITCEEISSKISQLEDRVTRLIQLARQGRTAGAAQHDENCPCCAQHRRQLEGLEQKISQLEGNLR